MFIKMSLVIGLCFSKFFDPCPLIKPNRKDGDYSSPEGNVHISAAFLGSWKYHFWRLVTIFEEGFLFAYFFCFCVATHLLCWTSDTLGALPCVHHALSHSVLATVLSAKMNLRLGLAPRPVWLQAFATFSSLPCLGSSNMGFSSWHGRDTFLQSKTFLWCVWGGGGG